MLGSMVARALAADAALKVCTTVRSADRLSPDVASIGQPAVLDAASCSVIDLTRLLDGAAWAVNCIGLIKPYIHDDSARETEAALWINSLFPHFLAAAGERVGCRILQIATDCVYSGRNGGYVETDPHDAWDVYGKTKSLGEVSSPVMHHLRCSVIGHQLGGRSSLLEWFLGQKANACVPGFTDHRWNGVTTLQFARLCHGIISKELSLPRLSHVLPAAPITKADLLGLFASSYQRTDIHIRSGPSATAVDRTLGTNQPDVNVRLWHAAGYDTPPSMERMLDELASWYRESRLEDS